MFGWGKKKETKLDGLFNLLAKADETYGKLPPRLRLEVEKISRGLSEFGPRKLHRRGPGAEFFESRDFRPDTDEPRKINARLSARAGKPVVIEREAEIRQHFYLWRDSSPSMDFRSGRKFYTKKQAAEIMLLAFAKHLAKNEELIGILDRKGAHRGGKAPESLAGHLADVTIVTGNLPALARPLPRHSTVVLFSDFLVDPDELVKNLGTLNGVDLGGFLVMVLDPEELEFTYKGHVEFEGMENEGLQKFKKTEALKAAYQMEMKNHIDAIEKICAAKGFRFILQRSDRPLYNALMTIYGLSPNAPAQNPAPEI